MTTDKPTSEEPEKDGTLPEPDAVLPAEPAEGPPAEPPPVATEAPEPAPEPPKGNLQWYVVKVQSGREESIKEAIEKKVKIEGLQDFFGQIVIPTEKVSEV